MSLLPVALTCGEPAGVGPEITVKAWEVLRHGHPFFWIGDQNHLRADTEIALITHPSEAASVFADALPVLHIPFDEARQSGKLRPTHAKDVIKSIEMAVSYTQNGEALAVCTNPINKKALKDGAGFAYPGHTEFLAALGQTKDVVMMLASPELKVVPATIHIPLADVPFALTADNLSNCIRVTHNALRSDFGIPKPRIAVAGLNPHAGEGGAMGLEDTSIISPVIASLISEGFDLVGPLPADTMFHARARQGYDAAVCMYHDQALIPIKTLDFDRGVNVTLGLPFVRTSPDHGTALDIAGKGNANPTSLIEALKLANEMGAKRTGYGRI